MVLAHDKKPTPGAAAKAPAANAALDAQKKSLATRESAKRGGFDAQAKALAPAAGHNVVDAQDPVAMAKLAEAEKNAPAPKGVDAATMGEIESAYRAATTPKLDKDALGKVAARCTELTRIATAEQRQRLEAIISTFVTQMPQTNVVDAN